VAAEKPEKKAPVEKEAREIIVIPQVSIYEAINAVMQEVGSVAKSKENKEQKFIYRGIEQVQNAVHGPMSRNGVVCSQHAVQVLSESVTETKSGGSMFRCRLMITYRFYGPQKDFIECTFAGEGSDTADKALNKAQSYALKVCLLTTFMIGTEGGMADGDASSPGFEPEADELEFGWGPKKVDGKVPQGGWYNPGKPESANEDKLLTDARKSGSPKAYKAAVKQLSDKFAIQGAHKDAMRTAYADLIAAEKAKNTPPAQ